jgi:hypothetical protein
MLVAGEIPHIKTDDIDMDEKESSADVLDRLEVCFAPLLNISAHVHRIFLLLYRCV